MGPRVPRLAAVLLPLVILQAFSGIVHANTYPTLPDKGGFYFVGEKCMTAWANQNGPAWEDVRVELMSGVETPILTVAEHLNCSASRSISFKCPDVKPYAEIYFYRYINNDDSAFRTFSARFTIGKKFKTKGVAVASPTITPEQTSSWRKSNGDMTTVRYEDGKLVGAAAKTKTLDESDLTTSGGTRDSSSKSKTDSDSESSSKKKDRSSTNSAHKAEKTDVKEDKELKEEKKEKDKAKEKEKEKEEEDQNNDEPEVIDETNTAVRLLHMYDAARLAAWFSMLIVPIWM